MQSTKAELLTLLEERQRRNKQRAVSLAFSRMYDWQREFTRRTAQFYECCLCAANQIGKTFTGTTIDAAHLTGDYPDDWDGHRFNFPPTLWLLGYSMEKARDLLQTALFGNFSAGRFSGGLVPAERVLSWESATGTPNAMRTVRVSHALGGVATVQFWSYSQGQHALMGDVVDWFHIDEEPKDQEIRPQVLTRTLNGDRGRGGRGIYTFTPENGRTELVTMFMDDPSNDQFFMQKGWSDAPHITPEKQERMLAQYPTHQREMRTKGTPMLGHGRVYDLSEDYVSCEAPDVQPHWYVIDGMDFGYDHPQAHIQLIEDRDNEMFYVTHAYKERLLSANDAWGAVRPWAEGIPTAWPHDGLQHEKARQDSVQLMRHYVNAGFDMLPEHATWPDGGISVETGLYEINDLMKKGKFKIVKTLRPVLDEFLQYHRGSNGKISKTMDDLMDGIRYAYMMRRYAVRVGDVGAVHEPIKFEAWG